MVAQASHVQSWDSSDPMTTGWIEWSGGHLRALSVRCVPTGGTVWDSALLLARELAARPGWMRQLPVLELGAGTGLAGLTARKLGASRLTLTDLPNLLPLLETNLKLNGETSDACAARPLLWQQAGTSWLSSGHCFSRVVMSDVLYHEPQYDPLLNVLRVLARCFEGAPPLKVLWAQEAHHPELCNSLRTRLLEDRHRAAPQILVAIHLRGQARRHPWKFGN